MKTLLVILFASSAVFAQALPNPKLTPGAVFTTDSAVICAKSFRTGKYRHTSKELKKAVCAEYGVKDCPHQGTMELDHLIAIEDGGADVQWNLWVQMAPDFHWKDKLETKLHELVCAGKLPLTQAQHELATDWVAAYRKYIGPLPTDPHGS